MFAEEFPRIKYEDLDARHKENYNYQQLAAKLIQHGFISHRLTGDWKGADLIAQHVESSQFLKVQLKSRLTFAEKYRNKDLWIAFPDHGNWYLYPHDETLKRMSFLETNSWKTGSYSVKALSKGLVELLGPFLIGEKTNPAKERLFLTPGKWYAANFCEAGVIDSATGRSPIRIESIKWLNQKSECKLCFYHAAYPEGVRRKDYHLRISEHGPEFILADSINHELRRTVFLKTIDAGWIKQWFGIEATGVASLDELLNAKM